MVDIPIDLMTEETIRKLHPLPERACGSCTLCCTIMKVEFDNGEPTKEWMQPCKHLCKGGCGIYNDRPTSCRVFECVWLGSQRRKDSAMPSSERPDRTGVVMGINSKEVVIVHCKTPMAFKGERVWKRIMRFIRSGTKVTIDHGNGDHSVIESDGTVTPMEYIGLDKETNETLYRRKRK